MTGDGKEFQKELLQIAVSVTAAVHGDRRIPESF